MREKRFISAAGASTKTTVRMAHSGFASWGGLGTALLLSVSAANTQAASFDCAKAGRPVEKLICSEPKISRLDERMAATYRESLRRAPSLQAVHEEQRSWLRLRDYCRPDDLWQDPPRGLEAGECLQQVYQDRIKELRLRYLVPQDELPGAVEFIRREENIQNGNITGPQCQHFLEYVRAGKVEVIPPDISNASLASPELKRYLRGCDLEGMRSTGIQQPRMIDGQRHFAGTGRVWTRYDQFDAWSLKREDGEDLVVIYAGAMYFDAAKSAEFVTTAGPFWTSGPDFLVFAQPGCRRVGVASIPSPSRKGSAPPVRRQSELIRYQGKVYLLSLGNLAGWEEEDYQKIKLTKVNTTNTHTLCTFVKSENN